MLITNEIGLWLVGLGCKSFIMLYIEIPSYGHPPGRGSTPFGGELGSKSFVFNDLAVQNRGPSGVEKGRTKGENPVGVPDVLG